MGTVFAGGGACISRAGAGAETSAGGVVLGTCCCTTGGGAAEAGSVVPACAGSGWAVWLAWGAGEVGAGALVSPEPHVHGFHHTDLRGGAEDSSGGGVASLDALTGAG
ncbi:MAG: hypothetical protein EXR36_06890 [Betaproteobacteria bacterium]|nr:hypothetical protein [Betaproteobacteria bacterium]